MFPFLFLLVKFFRIILMDIYYATDSYFIHFKLGLKYFKHFLYIFDVHIAGYF